MLDRKRGFAVPPRGGQTPLGGAAAPPKQIEKDLGREGKHLSAVVHRYELDAGLMLIVVLFVFTTVRLICRLPHILFATRRALEAF
jgi:hypothetical protein